MHCPSYRDTKLIIYLNKLEPTNKFYNFNKILPPEQTLAKNKTIISNKNKKISNLF